MLVNGLCFSAQAAENGAVSATVKAAAQELCGQMTERKQTCTVTLQNDSGSAPSAEEMYRQATTALGNGKDGDYLIWQVKSHNGSTGTSDGKVTYTYQMSYLTTAEQEAAVDQKVSEILKSLNLSGKSTYDKVKAIYRWLYTNIVIEEDVSRSMRDVSLQTAYGGLTNGISSCQGISEILCRLLGQEGITCRMVAGYSGPPQSNGSYFMNHVWNLVRVGSLYYNCDATWDSSLYKNEGRSIDYCFLRGEKTAFADNGTYVHVRCAYNGIDYASEAFYKECPMSDSDCKPGEGEPAKPSEPTKPTEPTKPVDPVKPTEPTKPSAPAEPTVPEGKEIKECQFTLSYTSKTYSGKALKPSVTVMDGEKKLVKGEDYTLSYRNNVDAGKASVTVKGKGNYVGSKKLTYKITKASGNKITASGKKLKRKKSKNQTFKLKVTVKKEGSVLSFKSSTKKVTVSKSGKVTVKKGYRGTAKITITATHTNYKTVKKTVKVEVK